MTQDNQQNSILQLRPYDSVYNLVLTCGGIHEPRDFAIEVLRSMQKLCWFDAASVYFKAPSGSVEDQFLLNTDAYWSDVYLDYYSGLRNAQYSYNRSTRNEQGWNIRDWHQEEVTEFVVDLVRPRGLEYSIGFSLYDLDGCSRILFCMDRIRDQCFSDRELDALSMSIPMLDNLHKNFYYQRHSAAGNDGPNRALMEKANLTAREIQVANLLCEGISPTDISKKLCFTLGTAYKHIAHIYEKMNVSSRQQLMAKLLG